MVIKRDLPTSKATDYNEVAREFHRLVCRAASGSVCNLAFQYHSHLMHITPQHPDSGAYTLYAM